MMVFRRFLLVAFILACFNVRSGHACSPVAGYSSDARSLYLQASHVFIGVVKSVTPSTTDDSVSVKLSLLAAFKGAKSREITVTTGGNPGMCNGLGASFFVPEKTFLVFANKWGRSLVVGAFSGTKSVADADAAGDLATLVSIRRPF